MTDHSTTTERVAQELMDVVPRLWRLIALQAQGPDQDSALTLPQARALRLIVHGYRLPSEIARHTQITPASVSELIDGLVRRGLITRSEQPGDRRCTLLSVTDLGMRYYEASQKRALAALQQLLDELDPQDLAALDQGLSSLVDRLPARSLPVRSPDESQ